MDKETRISSASDSERPEMPAREKDVEAEAGPPTDTAPVLPESEASQATDIPDGGMEAWLQVLGSWVVLVNTWGLVNTFGIFQTYYETKLLPASSSSSIAWIGSIQAAMLMLVGVVSGSLYDAGYFREMLIGGLFLVVLGQFMTSLCTAYWQVLLAQGITIGTGMGLSFLPSTAILVQYFSRRRALALGVASTGSPLAGLVLPIIFSRLEPAVGFGWATRVIAFILLGINVVPVIFMHTRVPPPGGRRQAFDPTALRDPAFMVTIGALFFSFLVLYVPFFYVQLFGELHGLASKDFSPYLVTLLNVGSVFGRLLPNALADAAGSLNVLVGCTLASAVLLFGWLGIHDLAGLIVFALLYGLFSGGIVSITPSVVMTLTPDLSRVGARLGMNFLTTGIAVLIGPPIAGAILGGFSEARWQATIAYSAAGLTLGALFFAGSRLYLWRTKGGWWA